MSEDRKALLKKLIEYEEKVDKKHRVYNWKDKSMEELDEFTTPELKTEFNRLIELYKKTQQHKQTQQPSPGRTKPWRRGKKDEKTEKSKKTVKRMEFVQCTDCPKYCYIWREMTYEEREALLNNKKKLHDLLNCVPHRTPKALPPEWKGNR